MKTAITILQIVVSILLILIITIQTKGGGLGRSFGPGSGVSFKRRGLEQLIFKLTFVLSTVFVLLSIIQFFA